MERPKRPSSPQTGDPASCTSAPAGGVATAEAPLTTETAEKFPDPPKIPQAVQLRHRALSPFLEQFREWSSQLRDPHAVPFFAEIADRSIDLGCWERAVLKQTCAAERADRRPLGRFASQLSLEEILFRQAPSCRFGASLDCLWGRWTIAQRTVGTDCVVFHPPPLDQHFRFQQRVEQLHIQKFISQCPVE